MIQKNSPASAGLFFYYQYLLMNEKRQPSKRLPFVMRPPGVEPGSREPESHVRSITLRAHVAVLYQSTFIIISYSRLDCNHYLKLLIKITFSQEKSEFLGRLNRQLTIRWVL